MKKMVTYLTILSMMLTAVTPVMQPVFAADTPPVISTAADPDAFIDVAGEWVRTDSIYAYSMIHVNSDGSFTVLNTSGGSFNGTVKLENKSYCFYKEDGTLWNSFEVKTVTEDLTGAPKGTIPQKETVLYAKKNNDTVKNKFPNDEKAPDLEDATFVLYAYPDALTLLSGTWNEVDASGKTINTLKVGVDSTFTYGDIKGFVRITAEEYANHTFGFLYTFYTEDGTYLDEIPYSNTEIPDELFTGQSGEKHFVRGELDPVAALVGEWVRDDHVYANIMISVNPDGTFAVLDNAGGGFSGVVEAEENGFRFVKEDGTLWNTFVMDIIEEDTTDQEPGYMGEKAIVLYGQKNTDTVKIKYTDNDMQEYNLEDVTFVQYAGSYAISKITGKWNEVDETGKIVNTLTVGEDGSVTYGKINGYVRVAAMEYPNHVYDYNYLFFAKDGTYIDGIFIPDEDTINEMTTGQDGAKRFVRAEQSSAGDEYSMNDLAGVWYLESVPFNEFDVSKSQGVGQIEVQQDGSYSYFEFETQKPSKGTVKVEFEEHPDGTKTPWFSFYKADGTFWFGCQKSEDPECDYYMTIGQDGASCLVLSSYVTAMGHSLYETSIAKLAGAWEDGGEDPDILIINADGTFVISDKEGGVISEGNILLEEKKTADGNGEKNYNLYADNKLIASIPVTPDTVVNTFTIDKATFNRADSVKLDNGYTRIFTDPRPETAGPVLSNLEGTWASENDSVTFSDCEAYHALFSRSFTVGGKETVQTGHAYVEYLEDDKKVKTYFFNCYTNDGTLVTGFRYDDSLPVKELYLPGQVDDTIYKPVTNEMNIDDIVGEWYETNALDPLMLTITEDGKFELVFKGGGKDDGVVKAEPDAAGKKCYCFYDGEKLICTVPAGTDTLSIQHKLFGEITFARVDFHVQPMFGDANGDGKVSIEDAKLALDDHVAVNLTNLPQIIKDETARYNADVTGDGTITDRDARCILDYTVMDSIQLNPSWYELTKNENAPDAPAKK